MTGRILIIALVALASLGSSAARGQNSEPDPYAGRWSHEAMDADVSKPLSLVDDDFPKSQEVFELQLSALGDQPVERIRLLVAFGVSLYPAGGEQDEGLPYLLRASAEARSALPADSRIRAMVLATRGELEHVVRGPDTSIEAEAALAEALAIRLENPGPTTLEAVIASVLLGKIRGMTTRTRGDRKKIAEASELFQPLLTLAPPPAASRDFDVSSYFIDWTQMLIENGDAEAACAVLLRFPPVASRLRLNLDFIGAQTGIRLRDAGFEREAAPLIDFMGPPKAGGPRCG